MPNRLELPFDIVQLLVEFAASSSNRTARVLSLVSHECQLWSDVHLFGFLVGRGSDLETIMVDLLDKMCYDDASPRLARARQHVRSLSWSQQPSGTALCSLQRYIIYFPNLIQLCLWENYIPELSNVEFKFDFEMTHPTLTRVFTCSFSLSTLPARKFDYPFWKTITHLQLAPDYPLYKNDSPFAQPLLVSMTRLTHFAIGPLRYPSYQEGKLTDLDILVSRLQLSFPPSLTLCLLGIDANLITDETQGRISNLRLGVTDGRIVLWSMPSVNEDFVVCYESKDVFDVWSGIPDGKETFWEAGLACQRNRRQHLPSLTECYVDAPHESTQ
ncbi:hypothetical protein DL96DRAFT_1617339 [Flagelloscypha sp. PMI_526]|nr:hypothetical protein DL96DRAFT_1617339 [Flagelloscypha sp. PMI_526]